MISQLTWLTLITFICVRAETARLNDPLADPGFQHFYNLEYDEALNSFIKDAARNPSSPDACNHIAQTIIIRQMYRSGALESDLVTGGTNSFLKRPKLVLSPADDQQFSASLSRAMDLANARIEKNPKDTGALYALGVSHALRANYDSLVRKAWMDTLRDVTAARKLHNRVTEIDAGFVDARLIEGLHDYVIGSLPMHWKMLGVVAGFHGDRARGIRTLRLVAEQGRVNRIDAAMVLAAIYRREKKPAEAIPLLRDLIPRVPRNYLLRLELADMYGDLGDRSNALAAMDEVEKLKRSNAPGYQKLPDDKIRTARERLLARLNAMPSQRGRGEESAATRPMTSRAVLPR